MEWAGVCYGQRTQEHFIDGILNAQRYRDEILRPIVVPFIHDNHLMLQHDNARPHVARICTQFMEAENILVLAWPAYSPDMSPIEHVWDALDRRIRQCVPVPANIQQLRTAIEEEWTYIPQATINNLINSMRRRWQMVVTPDTDWFSDSPPGLPQYSKTAHFRVAFYCGQPKAHLCNNHAVYSAQNRPFVYIERSLSSAHEKWGQKQKCCVYIFVQCIYIYIYIYIYIFKCSLMLQKEKPCIKRRENF